jgi:hypothetical protein
VCGLPIRPVVVQNALASIEVGLRSASPGICVNARDSRRSVVDLASRVANLETALATTFASATFTVNDVQREVTLAAVRARGPDTQSAAMRSVSVPVDVGKFHRDQACVCPMSPNGAFLGFNLATFGYHLALVRKPRDYRDRTVAERDEHEQITVADDEDVTYVWIPPRSFYIIAGTARYDWLHKPINCKDKMFARVGLLFKWGTDDVQELCKRIIYCLVGIY